MIEIVYKLIPPKSDKLPEELSECNNYTTLIAEYNSVVQGVRCSLQCDNKHDQRSQSEAAILRVLTIHSVNKHHHLFYIQ